MKKVSSGWDDNYSDGRGEEPAAERFSSTIECTTPEPSFIPSSADSSAPISNPPRVDSWPGHFRICFLSRFYVKAAAQVNRASPTTLFSPVAIALIYNCLRTHPGNSHDRGGAWGASLEGLGLYMDLPHSRRARCRYKNLSKRKQPTDMGR